MNVNIDDEVLDKDSLIENWTEELIHYLGTEGKKIMNIENNKI